ncbi:hypothetical protein KDW_20140 [Dictyobacter vulcani]|uniref:Uncharacterized protein n=1 Tax=Dictyobacter vulcani TaxID=2607529 RepID=A0A5J4KL92_9CHLR|nr:hypothetical protein [Dictyobacter vulcani]GER87852.1 hypothetical protein KDW_20140 [Dictyobacter vulcani]
MVVREIAAELCEQLQQHGITQTDEVTLRQTLEQYVATYTLIKLAEWPARRWKCQYRLMMKDNMYDAQSVPEAYARAILAMLQQATANQDTPNEQSETD